MAIDPVGRIQQLLAYWEQGERPGLAVAVVQNGKCLYKKGYGLANLEYQVPITTETVFDIMSLAKQFTGMAVAMLITDGRLDLKDDVRQYIPEIPDFGNTITVGDLVHHTSGLRDFPSLLNLRGAGDRTTLDGILRMVQHQQSLNFFPGTEMVYSNTGYNMLAIIVERVSGLSFREWTKQHIFEPLGMEHTFFYDNQGEVVPERAYGYASGDDGTFEIIYNGLFSALGSSSLFTTIDDMIKWAGNFESGRVGGRKVLELMHMKDTLQNGSINNYAFGNSMGKHKGLPIVEHSGGGFAFNTDLLRFPEQELSVILFSNYDDFEVVQWAFRIADAFLNLKEEVKPALFTASSTGSIPQELLNKYVGSYFFPAEERNVNVSMLNDSTLTIQPDGGPLIALRPVGDHRFFVHPIDATISFVFGAADTIKYAVMQKGERSVEMPKVISAERPEAAPKVGSLEAYEGTYLSAELMTRYELKVDDEQLLADHFSNPDIYLDPIDGDHFRGSQWYFQDVRFIRTAEGRISGFYITNGPRARNILFSRVEDKER